MKLVSTLIYDIDLEDLDIDCINKVVIINSKISKDIHLQIQHLLGNELEEI